MKRVDGRQAVQKSISEIRRASCEKSLRNFANTYLPAHFRCKPSDMHLELFELLENAATEERGL